MEREGPGTLSSTLTQLSPAWPWCRQPLFSSPSPGDPRQIFVLSLLPPLASLSEITVFLKNFGLICNPCIFIWDIMQSFTHTQHYLSILGNKHLQFVLLPLSLEPSGFSLPVHYAEENTVVNCDHHPNTAQCHNLSPSPIMVPIMHLPLSSFHTLPASQSLC